MEGGWGSRMEGMTSHASFVLGSENKTQKCVRETWYMWWGI